MKKSRYSFSHAASRKKTTSIRMTKSVLQSTHVNNKQTLESRQVNGFMPCNNGQQD